MSWIKKAKAAAEQEIQDELDKEELTKHRAIKSRQRDNDLIVNAREEGFREGFDDFERRLANSNQYAPVVEGSPQDIQMQENIYNGVNYQDPEGPSLLDAISGQIEKAADWFSDSPEQKPEQEVYAELAQQSDEDMLEDAQTSAFMQAEAMQDMSEENINNLVTVELHKRGL